MRPARDRTQPPDLTGFLPLARTPGGAGAFARRAPMVPWTGAAPVLPADAAPLWAGIERTPREERTVAYVHIPFCHNHCLFCAFYQNPYEEERSGWFVDLLIDEIRAKARTAFVRHGPAIDAVYFGGGTPTALAASDLRRLIDTAREYLPLGPDCEITLEGRAFALDEAKTAAAFEAGVNRISLGVQSFDTQVRRRLGRKLDETSLVAVLERLIDVDHAAIVVDLMYGLPGQRHEVWRRDLDIACGLGLDGLSFYATSIWPNGPLAQAIRAGKALPVPTLADQVADHAEASGRLAGEGWRRIAQSHCARTRRERNIYNRAVKAGATCLAFGPGAGGSGHGHSWRNVSDLAQWEATVRAGMPVVAGLSRLPPSHRAQSLVTAGLELGELDCAAVERCVPGFRAEAGALITAWHDAGLVECMGERLITTTAGGFWMTTLAGGLIAAIEIARRKGKSQ